MKIIYNIKKNYYGRYLVNITFTAPVYYKGEYGEHLYTKTHKIEIIEHDADGIIYNNGDGKERRAALQLAEWAKHLHGNAPAGTFYGSYRVQLADGARVSFPVYVGDEY